MDEYAYFRNVTIGGRRYLLKERDEDLPKAKAHFDRYGGTQQEFP